VSSELCRNDHAGETTGPLRKAAFWIFRRQYKPRWRESEGATGATNAPNALKLGCFGRFQEQAGQRSFGAEVKMTDASNGDMQLAPGQVALGDCSPRAPTDPYVRTLPHTVHRMMDSPCSNAAYSSTTDSPQ
jgi:hypothetical protein